MLLLDIHPMASLHAGSRSAALFHSSGHTWVPLLLLAAYAAADLAAQALAPAAAYAATLGWPSLPQGVLDFLQDVGGGQVGWSCSPAVSAC